MKLSEIYKIAVEEGIKVDPRGEEYVKKELELENKRYHQMSEKEKKTYDTERLTNPFPDTRILSGDPEMDVKSALVGIDMDVGEVTLADRLNERGEEINLIWSHHPQGIARNYLYDVMKMQAEMLHKYGVPINVAEGILEPRILEVRRALLPFNSSRAVDAAGLMGFAFLSTHTVADNHVTHFLQNLFDEKKPDTVGDCLDLLESIPEYQDTKKLGTGMLVLSKSKPAETNYHKISAGKVFIDMTGGTGGSKEAFEKLTQTTDIGTIIGMHIREENLKKAKENHINVIVAGHMASDSLGMNLLIDKIQKKGEIKIIPTSGFKRIERT
ncbi:MAG: NGG1p interacting factor NIF3 [Candidatus Coatesbacteria bacterium]|nr:MAG: NGG1p interacting factor NIF3 [Candidatus Coatesbacteria bacterium]